MPASAYASYAASTIMSAGAWSQFSPNLQHPMPTIATLSRMAAVFIPRLLGVLETCWRALPVIVGRPAGLVDLPEGELDGQVELHLLRARVGHLEIEARPIDVGHGGDERRVRSAREVVEGERLERAAPVGETHLVEVVPRVATIADPLEGILHRRAAPAAVRKQTHVLVPVAEVDRRRDAGSGAPVVLGGEQLPEAEVLVVPGE